MDSVKLTPEQVDMIDRRIGSLCKHLMRPSDFDNFLRDIYFQGFTDCHEAMTYEQ